ncbi:MAG TPA: hypothetical protein VN364_08205 [Bellilinea sp.]|nr:hypothetical protein [Bellilinea sp.]
MSEAEIQIAFALWRWQMWSEGYGSYTAIEWAVKWGVLQPFRVPKRTARLRKWIIQKFGPSNREEDGEG